ncbi:MAG: hypothetical protein R6W91_04820 [Thermoplasmata archaeon]
MEWIQKPKFDAAKDTGTDFESMHEEQMHNFCELTERNEVLWSAPLNL